MYVVPRGELDDLYWMYATTVPPPPPPPASTTADTSSSSSSTASGASSMMLAVSNDCLRDHWVGLLQARAFQRWRDSQVGRDHPPPPSLARMHCSPPPPAVCMCVRGCCWQVSSFHMHYNEEGNVTHATFRYQLPPAQALPPSRLFGLTSSLLLSLCLRGLLHVDDHLCLFL